MPTTGQQFLSISTLLTILSSGVITVLVTFLTNLWINKNNFKNEYYKKLIDKRLEAYEVLENVNRTLNLFVYDEKTKGVYFVAFSDPNYWEMLNKFIFESLLYSRWHSNETQETLHKLSLTIAKIGTSLGKNITENRLETETSPYLTELLQLKRDLFEYSLLDFQNLHNFNSFFSLNKQQINQRRSRRKLKK